MDIHNYEHIYQRTVKKLNLDPLSPQNKKLILDFANELMLENLSKPRLIKYVDTLSIIARKIGKDLDQATEEDLKSFVGMVQQRNDYSPWTKQSYKLIIRRFYKWLHGLNGTPELPKIVKWINLRFSKSERKLPSEGDLLTEVEIKNMLSAAIHPRDKALLAMLWESGARIGEIGNLSLKNVKFDKHGAVATVQGKTGSRNIRLIWSVPYLSTWINCHPFREEGSSPLWVNIGTRNHLKAIQYQNIRMLLLALAEKAGIKKRIHPHLFRHSRATFMANHLTEFQMNQYFGWIQGSDMPSTYVHMSGKEVDEAILRMNGLPIEPKDAHSQLQSQVCTRCDTINSQDGKFCLKCGGALNLKTVLEWEEQRKELDNRMNHLMRDKEVQEFLLTKLKGLTI